MESTETKKPKRKKDRLEALIGGIIIGMASTIGIQLIDSPNVAKVQVFNRGEKPAVMRLYKSGRDGLYVEDLAFRGEYLKLKEYLNGIENKADRMVEEAEIKKIARWYD